MGPQVVTRIVSTAVVTALEPSGDTFGVELVSEYQPTPFVLDLLTVEPQNGR